MVRIGPSIRITGDVRSTEPVQIDGHVRGTVNMRDTTVTIGPTAVVEADVRGARVAVLGTVQGNISATERIDLAPTANVKGSLSANIVVLADGARFNGAIDMGQRTIAAKVAQYRDAQR